MPSESSSPDPNAICECHHAHVSHTNARCVECDALDAGGYMHAFRLPEAEPPEPAAIVDVELPEAPIAHVWQPPRAGCIACGGPDCICGDLCRCGHIRRQHAASRPDGKTPRACGQCFTQGEDWEHAFVLKGPEALNPDDRCTCGHKRKKHSSKWSAGWVKKICHKCSDKDVVTWDHVFELGPQPTIEDWPCGDCGATVPGDLAWCPACDAKQEAFEAQLRGEAMVPRPAPAPPRRPPYAVAYSIEGGHLYEIGLPGDATVTAEDGVLKISHPSAVLALVQSRPMTFQETADADQVPSDSAG